VTEEEAKQFGAEHNIFTVETSAKTGSNVELAFSAITQEVIYLFIHKLIMIYIICNLTIFFSMHFYKYNINKSKKIVLISIAY
jgi:hypothetical protein